MGIIEKIKGWIGSNKKSGSNLMHVCRACQHIFKQEEMSASDPSICKMCSRRE